MSRTTLRPARAAGTRTLCGTPLRRAGQLRREQFAETVEAHPLGGVQSENVEAVARDGAHLPMLHAHACRRVEVRPLLAPGRHGEKKADETVAELLAAAALLRREIVHDQFPFAGKPKVRLVSGTGDDSEIDGLEVVAKECAQHETGRGKV